MWSCSVQSLPLGEVELMETGERYEGAAKVMGSLPLGEVELMETVDGNNLPIFIF